MTCPGCGDRMTLDTFGDDDADAKFICHSCGLIVYREVKADPPAGRFGHARTAFSAVRPLVPECLW